MHPTPRIHVVCRKCKMEDREGSHFDGEWFDATDGLDIAVHDRFTLDDEMLCGGTGLIDEAEGFEPYPLADHDHTIEEAEEIGSAIEFHGTLIAAIMQEEDISASEAVARFKHDYRGAYKTLAAFGEDFVRNSEGYISAYIRDHIDWNGVGEALTEDMTVIEHDGEIHLFADS